MRIGDALGANPDRDDHAIDSGDWTLRFLLITLAVTPLRRLTGWNDVVARAADARPVRVLLRARCTCSPTSWLDQFFDWAAIVKDVAKRPFITAGFAALRAAGAAGGHLDRRHDPPAWRPDAGSGCTASPT
ncbi:MAG: hypothetical protein MZW92_07520 [Comamonadaceae bacterium]|nr:hypothetical protein [Comamonadaceae bacterium]